MTQTIDSFDFPKGRKLADKYRVLEKIGEGWEGEIYLVQEISTKIELAAKFFYPKRNRSNKTLVTYAKKLNRVRHCSLAIQYHSQEKIRFKGQDVFMLVSEFVEGELLKDFLARQPRKQLSAFQALHLLYELTKGIEEFHKAKEYHGDLHAENIIIRRAGLGFDLKLIDMYDWRDSKRSNQKEDIVDLIKIFYDALGGKKYYAKHPKVVKTLCCGLRRDLILKKFKTVRQLKEAIESLEWD